MFYVDAKDRYEAEEAAREEAAAAARREAAMEAYWDSCSDEDYEAAEEVAAGWEEVWAAVDAYEEDDGEAEAERRAIYEAEGWV